ncbi:MULTISPECIES: hypothetical protein [Planktothricoides]|uniref:Uncharacterized protein n=2 Tax=Planktothricoides raciborskii TaxID=132608 RepID=A0AAU8JGT5_9CYAN|nr:MULTISPECIES: hypothetical protein [Planktothricoides]KOR35541.1 hypothetical protein AM228_17825 [Planktothricoides sp. SR001]MBD2547135.1 hypothetical protein [Planktothricoides raciborskii FACHB-1370]MBD2585690.1 hypothetical protein [Planktothricoides raciborskii FACHB-1261]
MKATLVKIVLTAVSGAIATGFSFGGFVVEPASAQVSLTKQDNPFNTELRNNCHDNCEEHCNGEHENDTSSDQ